MVSYFTLGISKNIFINIEIFDIIKNMTEGVRFDPHNTDLSRKPSGGSGSGVGREVSTGSTLFTNSDKLLPNSKLSVVKESHPIKDPNVSPNKIRAKLNRR